MAVEVSWVGQGGKGGLLSNLGVVGCATPALLPSCLSLKLTHTSLLPLRLQRETVDESGGSYLLGTGSPPQEHPLAALAVGGDASKTTSGAAGRVASPGPDLAALLSSPPHGGGGHRRTLSRGGSGLSRLISKNWESDLQVCG